MDMLKIEAAAKVLAALTPEQREFALYLAERENPAPKKRGRPEGSKNRPKGGFCSCIGKGDNPECLVHGNAAHPADVAEHERGQ